MDSKICFEIIFFVVEAIRERCASFMILTATVSEIYGGQTNVSILVVYIITAICPRSSGQHQVEQLTQHMCQHRSGAYKNKLFHYLFSVGLLNTFIP